MNFPPALDKLCKMLIAYNAPPVMGNNCSSFDSCLYPKIEPAKNYSLKNLEPKLVVEVIKKVGFTFTM